MDKIGIFMWFDDNIKDYAEINYTINKIYCDKYNYSLIKSNVRRCPERKPHWERIPLILEYFDKFDYLIWIDADAHFYVDSPPITNVIEEYPDKLFIFSGDTDIKKDEKISIQINSGVFIVKPSELSKNILDIWLKDEQLFKSPQLSKPIFGSNNWNDQAILRLMYNENILDIKKNSKIIDYGILQHFNKSHKLKELEFNLETKPFIFHSTNGSNMIFKNRVKNSKEYYSNVILNKYSNYINKNIQLARPVMGDIIMNCEGKKMLVFGLGYDSELWYNVTNKNTFFIEDNKTYISLNQNINSNNIIYHEYKNITVKKSFYLNDNKIENYTIPEQLLKHAPFDIILIDGPNGSNDDAPGRLLPIFWSKRYLSKEGTIVYIDDSSRNLEKKCINKYLMNNPKTYFNERLGTMKILI